MENNIKEEWRDIERFEGRYQVSNLGRIRSVERIILSKRGKETKVSGCIKSQQNKNGYKRLSLWLNGKEVNVPVHRAVAKAFIPNP